MIAFAVFPMLLATFFATTSGLLPDRCSDWSLAGFYPGKDVTGIMNPIAEFTSGRAFEMNVTLSDSDRRVGIQKLTVCIDSTAHVEWVSAVVSSRSAKWEKQWKKRFNAQHYYPLGCEDYVASEWYGTCRSVMWSENACRAVLADTDGEHTVVRTIDVYRGEPKNISVSKEAGGIVYRLVPPENGGQVSVSSCE